MDNIFFFEEEISFTPPQPLAIKSWITTIALQEGFTIQCLNFIFCSDSYLHQINLEYLNHDNLTDVITFDNAESDKALEGDVFISIERIEENALLFSSNFEKELFRVMIHGVFHLCGYLDKTSDEAKVMRSKEDNALQQLASFFSRGTFSP
ncbi:MAG: rRNA maturation RNase YbeY [Thermonemataceae bacterium]